MTANSGSAQLPNPGQANPDPPMTWAQTLEPQTPLMAQYSEPAPAAKESVSERDREIDRILSAFRGIKLSGLWYFSYQTGETGNTTGGSNVNQFAIKRGYLTLEKDIFSWFRGRITTDVTTVSDPTSNLNGSLAVRIKYLYGQFIAPDFYFLTKANLEAGVVHMPWIDFEEHINYYRLQDTLFMERNGIANSADIGVTFATLLGGVMDENYQKNVNSAYPGRYGSVQAGVYNGGGYNASESNQNKVVEGRVTIRPLPDYIPGLQFSYFGLTGKGNTSREPDWRSNLAFVSYEHQYVVLTGQCYWGKGNQQGSDEFDKEGYSFFAELKPHRKFSVIGRFDHFDQNKSVGNASNNRYIVGVAYHIDRPHNNMILLDYDEVEYKHPENHTINALN